MGQSESLSWSPVWNFPQCHLRYGNLRRIDVNVDIEGSNFDIDSTSFDIVFAHKKVDIEEQWLWKSHTFMVASAGETDHELAMTN